ncbi:peptidoglycan-binding protein [Flexibacterium corallicola]|uniref:peptidoglycan-binding protein n=1 Tax=Flexibacterium corallicola TaxID=3037259 RepID=UPI00286F5236|nr:peptidoglycan-binding protein [Pseudovibrio sp. M1P-2-3]
MSWNTSSLTKLEQDRVLEAALESGISADEIVEALRKSQNHASRPMNRNTPPAAGRYEGPGHMRQEYPREPADPYSRPVQEGRTHHDELQDVADALSRLMPRSENKPAKMNNDGLRTKRQLNDQGAAPTYRQSSFTGGGSASDEWSFHREHPQKFDTLERPEEYNVRNQKDQRINSALQALNELDARLEQIASREERTRDNAQELHEEHGRANQRTFESLSEQIGQLTHMASTRHFELKEGVEGELSSLRYEAEQRHKSQKGYLAEILSRFESENRDKDVLVKELRAEIEQINETLSNHSVERELVMLDQKYSDIAARLGELSRKGADPEIYSSLAARLEDIERHLGQLPRVSQLDAMEGRLSAISGHLDAMAADMEADSLRSVRDDLKKLQEAVSGLETGNILREVDEQIRFMMARMDELEHFTSIQKDIQVRLCNMEDRLPETAVMDRLNSQLETISGLLLNERKGFKKSKQLDRVEERLQQLGKQLGSLTKSGGFETGFEDSFGIIEQRLDGLSSKIDSLQTQALAPLHEQARDKGDQSALLRLEKKIFDLSDKIECSADQGAFGRDVNELRQELSDLKQQVGGLTSSEDFKQQLAELGISLNQAQKSDDDRLLDLIGQQMSVLARKVDQTQRHMLSGEDLHCAVEGIGEQLQQVQAHLQEKAQGVAEAVGIQAQHEQGEGFKGVEQSISALKADLTALVESSGQSERYSQEGFASLQKVLGNIANHLQMLGERQPKREQTALSKEHESAIRAKDTLGVPVSLKQAPAKETMGAQEETSSNSEQDRQERKADFIAAARRAAQAASQEAKREVEEQAKADRKNKWSLKSLARKPIGVEEKKETPPKSLQEHLKSIRDEEINERPVSPVEDMQGKGADVTGLSDYVSQIDTQKTEVEESGTLAFGRKRKRTIMLSAAAIVMAIAGLQLVNWSNIIEGERETQNASSSVAIEETLGDAPLPFENEATSIKETTGSVELSRADTLPAYPVEIGGSDNDTVQVPESSGARETLDIPKISMDMPDSAQPVSVQKLEDTEQLLLGFPREEAPQSFVKSANMDLFLSGIAQEDTGGNLGGRQGSDDPLMAFQGTDALRQAALSGDGAAQYLVGLYYDEDYGGLNGQKRALEWYRKAAVQGVVPAQFRLGTLYAKGYGVEKDRELARTWYETAASQGNVTAMHNLAVLYAEGVAGEPDYPQAYRWFSNAAQFGVADSQFNLGVLTAKGLGTKKDLITSYQWFALVATKGDRDAIAKRDEIATELSPVDLLAAKKKVEDFKVDFINPMVNEVAVPEEWKETSIGSVADGMSQTVLQAQKYLTLLGYDTGGMDGFIGPKTAAAISLYQQKTGLLVTGTVDKELMLQLAGDTI